MVPNVSLTPVLRALLLGGALSLLAGCSIFGGKDDETNNANKDAANYRERTVEQMPAPGTSAPPSSMKSTASIPIPSGPGAPC
jgi:hypothetical protein